MENRPVGAFILSLLGGIFTLLGTLMALAYAPSCNGFSYCYIPPYYWPFVITATVAGVVVLLGAAMLYRRPEYRVVWGIVILVLAATSAVGVITGYFALFGVVGLVLGIVGGALAVASKPGEPGYAGPSGGVRLCTGCGRFVPLAYPYCAFCGTAAPSFRPGTTGAPPPRP